MGGLRRRGLRRRGEIAAGIEQRRQDVVPVIGLVKAT